MLLSSTRKDWLGNVRGDVLAGIVVALALIPEAIAFSIIAGVDPRWASTRRSVFLSLWPSLADVRR
jgi:MFS superfamily sulfate permease-like transporter